MPFVLTLLRVFLMLVCATTAPDVAHSEDTRSTAGGKSFRDCTTCPQMVVLPAGTVLLGSDQPERDQAVRDHLPAESTTDEERRRVSLPRFAMSAHEITRGQFATFVAESGHVTERRCGLMKGAFPVVTEGFSWERPGFPQTAEHPAVCVTWFDAVAFTKWLSQKTGKAYRLPSEAEWEYGARAGTLTVRFWGNDMKRACEYANVRDRAYAVASHGDPSGGAEDCNDGYYATAPVGTFKPNAFGLYDMLGNAWEWIADCYHAAVERSSGSGRPSADLVESCDERAHRGGGWSSIAGGQRSANRGHLPPSSRMNYTGFRVARDMP